MQWWTNLRRRYSPRRSGRRCCRAIERMALSTLDLNAESPSGQQTNESYSTLTLRPNERSHPVSEDSEITQMVTTGVFAEWRVWAWFTNRLANWLSEVETVHAPVISCTRSLTHGITRGGRISDLTMITRVIVIGSLIIQALVMPLFSLLTCTRDNARAELEKLT